VRGIGHVGQHFAFEIGVDAFLERHGLGVAQIGVRLGLAVAVVKPRALSPLSHADSPA